MQRIEEPTGEGPVMRGAEEYSLIMSKCRTLGALAALILAGCSSSGSAGNTAGGAGSSGGGNTGNTGGSTNTGGTSSGGAAGTAPGVSSECGSVRLTQYGSTDRRWCGFDRTNALLPDFVRQGMTVAIAEPYNGSSYEGDPGEACGECWELDTTFATQVIMVHDLCPIEGNPICNGSHFHFDVSNEVASVIDGGGWMGEASARRIPCPVSGNIHAYISDRNQWGYLKVAFFNHRFPIRTVEYRPEGSSDWQPMERCLARWCVPDDDKSTFSESGPGAVFRLTSPTGEVVEGTQVLTYATAAESDFDTGAQFAPAQADGGTCEFIPPGDVYDEQWGGIDGVRWEPNTWGGASLSEINAGCAESSPSCLLVSGFEGSGLHITYRHVFPTSTFSHLRLQLRAQSGGGEVEVAPRSEASRCDTPTTVAVNDQWVQVDIDVAASCPGFDDIHGLTISRPSAPMDLVVDEIFFE